MQHFPQIAISEKGESWLAQGEIQTELRGNQITAVEERNLQIEDKKQAVKDS